jgi:outer membrane protein TolC
MNNGTHIPKAIRVGSILTLLAALAAFAAREAGAQTPVAPTRLTIGEAARLAASQTAPVQAANLRVQEAQARVREANSAFLPQISLNPNWTSHTVNSASFGFNFPAPAGEKPLLDPNGQIIGPVKLWDFRAQAAQTLFDPQARERVKTAKVGVTAASADVSTAAEQAAANAASIYVRALRTDAAVRARLADSTLASDLLVIARDQLAAGVGVALDVTRAQSQLASARAQLIVARNDRNRARLDLLRALNLPLDAAVELSDSLGATPVEAIDEQAAVNLAIQSRPEIRAADLQLALAQQQLATIKAGRLPTVGIFGNDGQNGFIKNLLNTYTYGIQVSWPVFEGGRREAQTQQQEAVSREIDVRRRDLRQQVTLDVRTALLDLGSAREQVDAARERQALAEQEVAQARERFRAGVAGNADVITASLTLNNARTGLVDALTAYEAARVALARAEGNVTQLR